MKKFFKLLVTPLLILIGSCNNQEEILCYGPPYDDNYTNPDLETEYTLPSHLDKTEGTLYFDDIAPLLSASDDELFSIYKDIHCFPEKYKVINDYKIQDFALSSSSKEEALQNALSLKTSDNQNDSYCIATSSKYVSETDLFYIVDVTWDYYSDGEKRSSYEDNVVSFKKEYAECNRLGSNLLTIVDFIKTQEIIDSFIIGFHQFFYSYVFVCSALTEQNNSYIYTSYTMHISYGDWGMDNTLYLFEQESIIDKETGIVDFKQTKELREIYFK